MEQAINYSMLIPKRWQQRVRTMPRMNEGDCLGCLEGVIDQDALPQSEGTPRRSTGWLTRMRKHKPQLWHRLKLKRLRSQIDQA